MFAQLCTGRKQTPPGRGVAVNTSWQSAQGQHSSTELLVVHKPEGALMTNNRDCINSGVELSHQCISSGHLPGLLRMCKPVSSSTSLTAQLAMLSPGSRDKQKLRQHWLQSLAPTTG